MSKLMLVLDELKKFARFKIQILLTAEDDSGSPYMVLNAPLNVATDTRLRNSLQRALAILHQGNGQDAYIAACKVEDALLEVEAHLRGMDVNSLIVVDPDDPRAVHASDLEFWKHMLPEEFGDMCSDESSPQSTREDKDD